MLISQKRAPSGETLAVIGIALAVMLACYVLRSICPGTQVVEWLFRVTAA
jgi:hypothetical protein